MANYFSRKDLIYTVYQEGSISKAAQKLFVSQPSLSVMIHRIEEELGVPLFDRTSKPIRLSEAGQEYIKAAEEIMHIEKSFENYLQACDELQTGSLTIGSNQLLSSLVLPKYISEFILRYPKIHLNLVDDNSVVLETMANAGTLDLVLDNHPLNPEIFEQHILRREQLLLAVPTHFECNQPQFALTHQDILNDRHYDEDVQPVDLHPFENVPFVAMTKENDTRMRVDEILKKGGIKPRTILEIDRLATLYSFIEQGTAASIVSDTLVQHLQHTSDHVLFYKLSSPQASRELYLSYKRNRYYSKAMQAFAELIEQFKK
jgi:DNA-binding transcriptional LysR family regulator